MNEEINKLKIIFNQIKDKELIKCLRPGSTGIGYTFESLIGKKEDKIHISFNIGPYLSVDRYGQINDRGTAFRILTQNIKDLFEIVT